MKINDKEKHMILSALEFFVDYRFITGQKIADQYIEMTSEIDQNEYSKLCKRMGGEARWLPTK